MTTSTAITFHDVPRSDSVEAAIHRWVARLEHLSDRLIRCEVRVEQPHKSSRHGRGFEIHVVLALPGNEISASRARSEDIYVAIADAFRATRRQLIEALEVRRAFVPTPLAQATGVS